jgi:hypothetical protein
LARAQGGEIIPGPRYRPVTLVPPAWLVVFASGALLASLVTWLVLRPRRVEHRPGVDTEPRHRWGRIVADGPFDQDAET